MNKKNRGKYFLFAASMMLALIFTGCGSPSGAESAVEQKTDGVRTNNYAAADNGYSSGSGVSVDAATMEASETTGGLGDNTILSEDMASAESGRKLIKNASLDVETRAFDTFVSYLENEVESLGGYIEYSSVGGSSYVSEGSQRTAWYTARIPEEKLETFISKIGDNGNITNISRNVRDITLEYVDVAGRISTLETELERLNELLSEASSMEDILAIESKISDVRYELESYQGQMNTYDNLVDYSTVDIYVLEVDVVSANQGDSVWEQIQSGFMNNLYSLGRGLGGFIIGLICAIPYLAVIAVVVVIIVKIAHKKRAKKTKSDSDKQSRTDGKDQA